MNEVVTWLECDRTKCYDCGGKGNLVRDFTFKRTCYVCGKEGHVVRNCSNKRRRRVVERPRTRTEKRGFVEGKKGEHPRKGRIRIKWNYSLRGN